MSTSYFLDFHGESLKLFTSERLASTESDFIDLLETECSKKHIHLIAIQLKLIFEKFDSDNNTSFDWRDNLKTTLAHGFKVKRIDSKGNSATLEKSFSPVQFKLLADNSPEIHLGFFHMGSDQTISEQFIAYCRATEYPPNIHKHIISGALIKNGGLLLAINSNQNESLAQLDPLTKILSGHDLIIEFLSDLVTDIHGQ